MATSSATTPTRRPFEDVRSKKICCCSNKNCMQVLKNYYEDDDSIYPNNKGTPQLFIQLVDGDINVV